MTDVMRTEYRELSADEKTTLKQYKDKAAELYKLFDDSAPSREISLAKTNLEQAVMWAVKHITR